MVAKAQAEKAKLELSCREAHLLLRVIPLLKNVKGMKEEEVAAIKHYIYCKGCRDCGLADILDTKLSCKEAILVWAQHAAAMWLSCIDFITAEKLIEFYAVEHVWGKYQWENSMGGCGWDVTTSCQEQPCRSLHYYWAGVPMSSSAGDGPGGVIDLFPFLIETFLQEEWPLDELLTVQKDRIAAVLYCIKSGEVTVGNGHYNSVDELVAEMKEHVAALQKLAVRSQAKVVPA